MSKKKKNRERTQTIQRRSMVFTTGSVFDSECKKDYTPLNKIPEVRSAVRRIAQLVATPTIYLMSNTDDGDIRIKNELSRKIDIEPVKNMTRPVWMEAIVSTMLTHGNAIVVPHTERGLLGDLEPIAHDRVSLRPVTQTDYRIMIDGKDFDPEDVCHFVYNPDDHYLWQGRGIEVDMKAVLNNLKQARSTENAFMSSEYKPSIIVRVDSMSDELSDPKGRQRIIEDYLHPEEQGQPWVIPAEQFDIQQVKPLTLADLAINDSVRLDKQMVAAMIGVPAYVAGAGEFKRDEWNNFIQTTVMSITRSVAAELTRKLITSPKWYLEFNVWSLLDYDLQQMSNVLLSGSDRGYINGDEWRDRMHMSPAGLKEYKVLENYLPYDMSGKQKKLIQED